MGDGRGRRGLAGLVPLHDPHRVVVPAPARASASLGEVALADAGHGDPGRQRQGLLDAGEGEVDPVAVELDRGRGDPGDDVREEHGVGVGSEHLGHRAEGGRRPGGGLARDHGHGVEGALLGEGPGHVLGGHALPHGDLEPHDVLPQGLGDGGEALRERAVHEAEDARSDAGQRGLHHPRGARRVDRHVGVRSVLEPEGEPQVRVEALGHLGHGGGAVADRRARELGEDLGTDLRGAGDPESHGVVERRARGSGLWRNEGVLGRRGRRQGAA